MWKKFSNLLSTQRLLIKTTRKVSYNLIQVEQSNGIRTVTLNHDASRNALSLAMIKELHNAFQDDEQLRCICIQSASKRIFSAGHDLKELHPSQGSSLHEQIFCLTSELMIHMQNLPVPIITKIRGVAAAAGCQLVANSDIAVADTSARFSTPGINVGLFCSTPAVAVTRSANAKTAALMLFTGELISAQDAEKSGLISLCVVEEQLDQKVNEIMQSISNKSKSVIGLGKKLLVKQRGCSVNEAYKIATENMVYNLKLEDAKRGIEGFFDKKKKIDWTHTNSKI